MLLEIRGEQVEVTPINDFKFPSEHEEGFGNMFELTCRNHPTARYLTKNPHLRHLHFIEGPDGSPFECVCPYGDLVVVVVVRKAE